MIEESQVISIHAVEYCNEYKLKITFNDGTIQIVDFYPFLSRSFNPLIRKYLEIDLFQNYSIDQGYLEWNDYDLCFPIADLYENHIHP